MKALVLKSTSEPPTVEIGPTPQPTIGTAVVRILAANIIIYVRDIYNGKRNYPFPTPIILGNSAIARVAVVGPDATKLKPAALHEGFIEGSKKLMREVVRDWVYAEYCRAPLEILTPFNEQLLTSSLANGGLGYKIEYLADISHMLVQYGGLRDINLLAGEKVIIVPATGSVGVAGVRVALAMGAKVIAMGRNKASLESLKSKALYPYRLFTVPITGGMMADSAELKKFGTIDAYLDIGPPQEHESTHIKSAILSLRHGARVSLMGRYLEDIPIPHSAVMRKNLRLHGKWMFERSDILNLLKLVNIGELKLGEGGGTEIVGRFSLEQWKEAFDVAAENTGFGEMTLINA
ncbi:MAG: hypothetical protein FE78DRAFT_33619 [Acidomyces sp. 'richmondensis']|nr:MAG: hypothetical protein FE78DRAFT_33619 [Acidomyces sp. 'richmondensis']